MSNVVCFKHPVYRGETAPDLSCKMCCSMFVARIRADQIAQQDKSSSVEPMFKPLTSEPRMTKAPASGEKKRDFDASWI